MTKVAGIGGAAVTLEARHQPIEDGDIILFTLPERFSQVELGVAKQTCQRVRDELAAINKTVTTVVLIENWKLETAKRVEIEELYNRLGIALRYEALIPTTESPEIWLTGDRPEHEPERRAQKRKPAMERRKQPR